MEKFLAEVKNNPEFRAEFFAFAHAEEAKMQDSVKVIYDSLNKQVMDVYVRFAESKGMKLEDSELVKEGFSKICRETAQKMNKLMADMWKESEWFERLENLK